MKIIFNKYAFKSNVTENSRIIIRVSITKYKDNIMADAAKLVKLEQQAEMMYSHSVVVTYFVSLFYSRNWQYFYALSISRKRKKFISLEMNDM